MTAEITESQYRCDNCGGVFEKGWTDEEATAEPARWDSFGRGAGHRRNAVIASLPLRLLIAFPGGAGTASMKNHARARGIAVLEVEGAMELEDWQRA